MDVSSKFLHVNDKTPVIFTKFSGIESQQDISHIHKVLKNTVQTRHQSYSQSSQEYSQNKTPVIFTKFSGIESQQDQSYSQSSQEYSQNKTPVIFTKFSRIQSKQDTSHIHKILRNRVPTRHQSYSQNSQE